MRSYLRHTRRLGHGSRYSVQGKKQRRVLLLENLESRTVLSSGRLGAVTDGSPWQNPVGPSDLNGDGQVGALDVLLGVNQLNQGVFGDLSAKLAPPVLANQVQGASTYYLMVSGGTEVTGRYSLQVLNYGGQDYTPLAPSKFGVFLPSTAQSGQSVTVQLVALNAQNRPIISYLGTASLSSSDAAATLPDSVTFQHGQATVRVTFTTEGAQTLTATDATDATVTGSATTNVVDPVVATQLVVRLPQSVPSGVEVTVQLAAVDPDLRLVSNYSGTVTVSSSDSQATLPDSVMFEDGRATFKVTFATTGSQTLTMTDAENDTLTGSARTNVAAPAVATQLAVRLPQLVLSGTPVVVQILAVDALKHVVPTYSGTVTLSSSDSHATLPTSITFQNGVAWTKVTFATDGSQTLTVTDSSDTTLTGGATTSVVAVPELPATGTVSGTVWNDTGDFDITLNLTGLTASEQEIARQAAARWESVIVGDLPDVVSRGVTIDDVVVNIGLQRMDGSGGILGEGGPELLRGNNGLPYAGTIVLDTADVASLERQGKLLDVLTHEIGHVLGFGTVWDSKRLVSGGTSLNPVFVGAQATAAYNAAFGTHATGVPLENTGRPGDGTYGAHWRQTVLGQELMVGHITSGGMPLSSLTVAAMADIGYQVNMAAAEPYRATGTGASLAAASATNTSSGLTSLSSLPPLHLTETQVVDHTRRHARSVVVDRVFQETEWWFEV